MSKQQQTPETDGYYWVKMESMLHDGSVVKSWMVARYGIDGWWRVTGDGHPVVPDAPLVIGPKIEPPTE